MPEIRKIGWDEEALMWAALWGLSVSAVEDCIHHPQQTAVDPRTKEIGHNVLRHRRGDVVVVVGYREPETPQVLFVTTMTGLAERHVRGGNGGTGSTLPRSYRELRKRILDLGYRISVDSAHPKVRTSDGRVIMTFPGTPSDHRSLANTWRSFVKAHAKEMLRQIQQETDS